MSEPKLIYCPYCHEEGKTIGHVLGHLARGKSKRLTKGERERRKERMSHARKFRHRPPG